MWQVNLGPRKPGTDAHKACRDDRSAIYWRVPNLLDDLAIARGDGRLRRKMKTLAAFDVLILDEPTRGIDVGTKQEIYRLLRELADEGAAILFYSTDYDELIGSCDRVAILYDGRVVSELEGDRITEKNIIAASLNINASGHAAGQEKAHHG
mgnify:CR=1 FL=1